LVRGHDFEVKRKDLDSLDVCMPRTFSLQTDRLGARDRAPLHSGPVALFLHHLVQPHTSTRSLNPLPPADGLGLQGLIHECISMRIAPDRAAWAIQQLTARLGISRESVTRVAIDEAQSDLDYSIHLLHSLYRRNVVDHLLLVQALIAQLPAGRVGLFHAEIAGCFPLLKLALRTRADWAEGLRPRLLDKQSELVQFAASRKWRNFGFAGCLNRQMKRRAHALLSATGSLRAPLVIRLRNLFASEHPMCDIARIWAELAPTLALLDEADLADLALELVQMLHWFDCDCIGIAATIAALIARLKVEFPLRRFAEILCESPRTDPFVYLFLELQVHGVVAYADFWRVSRFVRATGDSHFVLTFPSIDRSPQMLAKLNMYLRRVGRLQSLDEILKDPLSGAVKPLPNVLRYLVGLWVIENRKDSSEVCSFLARSSLEPLIPLLFDGPAASLPQHCGPLFKRLVPVFHAREKFADLTRFALNRQNGMADLAKFLRDKYDLGDEAAAAQEAIGGSNWDKLKSVCVSPEKIRSLFRKYSFFCDLQTFDGFQGLKNGIDFPPLMTHFFRNLLTFQRIPSELFFLFFMDFADNGGVTRGHEMFVRTLSTVTVMCERDGISLMEAWPLLRATYSRIFVDEFQQPSQCLSMSAQISQRWRSSSSFFVKLLVDIVRENGNFSPNSILTEPVVKSYSIEPLTDLLAALRGCRLPTMTKELVRLLDCPPGHSQLPCAYFSLLPEGLFSANVHSAFEYFIEYVEHKNATFWALWLKFRPLYTLAFPVGLRANSNTLPVSHIQFLNEAFADLFIRQAKHEKMPLLADCWWLISSYGPFAASIMQDILARLRQRRLVFTQQFFDWCRPAMSVASEPWMTRITLTFVKVITRIALTVVLLRAPVELTVIARKFPLRFHSLNLTWSFLPLALLTSASGSVVLNVTASVT
jgi:hypothetical protein